jgi:hypothetical protein
MEICNSHPFLELPVVTWQEHEFMRNTNGLFYRARIDIYNEVIEKGQRCLGCPSTLTATTFISSISLSNSMIPPPLPPPHLSYYMGISCLNLAVINWVQSSPSCTQLGLQLSKVYYNTPTRQTTRKQLEMSARDCQPCHPFPVGT